MTNDHPHPRLTACEVKAAADRVLAALPPSRRQAMAAAKGKLGCRGGASAKRQRRITGEMAAGFMERLKKASEEEEA